MAKGELKYLPLDRLVSSKINSRRIDPQDLAFQELAESIRRQGVLEPLLIRKNGKSYEVQAGARRLAAAKLVGMKEVPCLEFDFTDQQAVEATLAENLHRENLTVLEEASNIAACLKRGFTADEISANLGKPKNWILRRASLMNLSPRWRKKIENTSDPVSFWPAGHLEIVARLTGHVQDSMLKIWEGDRHHWNNYLRPDLPLKELEKEIQEFTRELGKAPWKLDDPNPMRACTGCPQRSSARPGLFDEINLDDKKEARRDRCLDPACWGKKLQFYAGSKVKELEISHGQIIPLYGDHYSRTAALPELKDKARRFFEIQPMRQTDKGALPVVDVFTSAVSWGKVKNRQEKTKKKKTETTTETTIGDPQKRAAIAHEFARAQLAYTLGYDSTWLAEGNPSGRICAAICSLNDAPRGFCGGSRAYPWLHAKLDMYPVPHERPDEITEKLFYAAQIYEHRALYEHLARRNKPPKDHGGIESSLVDKSLTLGLFNYLTSLGQTAKFWFEVKVEYWRTAAAKFVLPRLFLHSHRKDDLLCIARSLKITIPGNAKVDQVVDSIMKANLPTGTLTPELAQAFNPPGGDSLDNIRKKIRKVK